jgi:hypothetical protein
MEFVSDLGDCGGDDEAVLDSVVISFESSVGEGGRCEKGKFSITEEEGQ